VDRLHDGDTATVKARRRAECLFDLMITNLDGHYWIVPGANLCTLHGLTLRSNGSGVTFDP